MQVTVNGSGHVVPDAVGMALHIQGGGAGECQSMALQTAARISQRSLAPAYCSSDPLYQCTEG
jgi:hypothetical protein